jgi:hypothetical protein
MSAEATMYAALAGAAGVTALVADRIYPDFLPQNKAQPAIVYTRSETEYVTTIHTGTPAAALVTMETWCFAKTRPAAEALADAAQVGLAAGGFLLIARRPEFDTDTESFSSVITSTLWT